MSAAYIDGFLLYRDFLVSNRPLSPIHFERALVWCEYYDPSELDDIERLGIDRDWLFKYVLDEMNETGFTAIYAVYDVNWIGGREFLYAKCSIEIDDFIGDGYVCIVEGEVTTVTVFVKNAEVDFYGSELLTSENWDAIQGLVQFGQNGRPTGILVKYLLASLSFFPNDRRQLWIPL